MNQVPAGWALTIGFFLAGQLMALGRGEQRGPVGRRTHRDFGREGALGSRSRREAPADYGGSECSLTGGDRLQEAALLLEARR